MCKICSRFSCTSFNILLFRARVLMPLELIYRSGPSLTFGSVNYSSLCESSVIFHFQLPCHAGSDALPLKMVWIFFFFPFGMPGNFFLPANQDVPGKRNCSKQIFSHVIFRKRQHLVPPMVIGLSVLMSLCSWTANFTSVSQGFFSPPSGGAGWLEWAVVW